MSLGGSAAGSGSPVLLQGVPNVAPAVAVSGVGAHKGLISPCPGPCSSTALGPVGLWLWQQRSLCWLQRSKAAPCCSFSLEALAVCSELCCEVGTHVLYQEQLSTFPSVAGCWPRGSSSAQAGTTLPVASPGMGQGGAWSLPAVWPGPRSADGAGGDCW